MRQRNPDQTPRLGRLSIVVVGLLTQAAFATVAGIGSLHSTAAAQKALPKVDPQDPTKTDLYGGPLPTGARARLGTVRLRHGDLVTFVAFSGDGKAVLTASQDATIRLWDRQNGKELRRFKGPAKMHFGPLNTWHALASMALSAVVLSRDGRLLAASDYKQGVQLWDMATGKELRRIEPPKDTVISTIQFTPDGKTLFGRGANRITYLFDTATGKELRQIKVQAKKSEGVVGYFGGFTTVAISANGRTITTGEQEIDNGNGKITTTLICTDLDTGKEIRQLDKSPDEVTGVAYSSDGKLLAYGCGDTIFLCDADTVKEIRQIALQGGISSLSFAPDSKTLAAKGNDQIIRLWETNTGKELQRFGEAAPGFGGNGVAFPSFGLPIAQGFAFSPDGEMLLAAFGRTLRLWEVSNGKELPLVGGHRRPVSALSIAPDGKTLVTHAADHMVSRWDVSTAKQLSHFATPQGTTSVAFSPDSRTVALGSTDTTIRVLDVATGKELHQFKGHTNGTSNLAFSPNGKHLASRGISDHSIQLYDVAKGQHLRQILVTTDKVMGPGGGFGGDLSVFAARALAFSPDGGTVMAHVPGTDNHLPNPMQPPPVPVPDTLRLWDVPTGKEIRRIALRHCNVTSVVFAPDGRVLATEDAAHTISLWEIASGKKRIRFGKPIPITDLEPEAIVVAPTLAFSPDGSLLAARGSGHAVSVWDVVGGKERGQLKGHERAIVALVFSPDGKWLASGSNDTTALVWDVTSLKHNPLPPSVELPPEEVTALWDELIGEDAAKAYQAILRLARAPKQMVPFLREHLKPAVAIDPKLLEKLIADLNSKNFQTRSKATTELGKLGDLAVPVLQKALAAKPSLETQQRVETLLKKLTGGALTEEQIRLVRAVEVLEKMGTADARLVLEALAEGAPGALATRQAQAALKRYTGD